MKPELVTQYNKHAIYHSAREDNLLAEATIITRVNWCTTVTFEVNGIKVECLLPKGTSVSDAYQKTYWLRREDTNLENDDWAVILGINQVGLIYKPGGKS